MYGYNPQVSDICTGLNSITAIANGITTSINAKNSGADPYQANMAGLFTTSMGLSNAFMGNCIDKATGTYWGTTTNNIYSTAASLGGYSGYYNFGAISPFIGFGIPTVPMFGLYNMTAFGGFCCYC